MDNDWITVGEAAQISGYHPEYLRDLLRRGKIRGKKFGSAWMVSSKSLQVYIHEAVLSSDARKGPQVAS